MSVKAINDIHALDWLGSADCITLAVGCVAVTLFSMRYLKRLPAALILFLLGIIMAMVLAVQGNIVVATPAFPPFWVGGLLNGQDFLSGFLQAGLPQIPLTLLNSVVSVCDLHAHFFPEKKLTRRTVASSVALMNVTSLFLGAMPMCHGAGGLAAQHRFGARGGFSVVFLGVIKVLFACILGTSAHALLSLFPVSVLSVLLLFSGLGLMMAGLKPRNQAVDSPEGMMTIVATGVATLTLKTGVGCLVGILVAGFTGEFQHIVDWVRSRGRRGSSTPGEEVDPSEGVGNDSCDDASSCEDQTASCSSASVTSIRMV